MVVSHHDYDMVGILLIIQDLIFYEKLLTNLEIQAYEDQSRPETLLLLIPHQIP